MGVLAIIGTLVGVLVGFGGNYFIQRQLKSWQREKWILEAKQSEWRELISTLCQNLNRVALSLTMDADGAIEKMTTKGSQKWIEAHAEALKTIQDRIFIAQRVKEEKIEDRWGLVMAASTTNAFYTRWNELHDSLVKAALDDLKI
jgi:hypothetical protein